VPAVLWNEAMHPGEPSRRIPSGSRVRAAGRLRSWLTALTVVVAGGALLVFGLVLATIVLAVGLVVGVLAYGVLRWKLRGWRARLDEAARQARAGRGEVIDVQARWSGDEKKR
jgi:hypothetical protein